MQQHVSVKCPNPKCLAKVDIPIPGDTTYGDLSIMPPELMGYINKPGGIKCGRCPVHFYLGSEVKQIWVYKLITFQPGKPQGSSTTSLCRNKKCYMCYPAGARFFSAAFGKNSA